MRPNLDRTTVDRPAALRDIGAYGSVRRIPRSQRDLGTRPLGFLGKTADHAATKSLGYLVVGVLKYRDCTPYRSND